MLQIGSAELEAILNTILSERGLASLRSYFRALKGLVEEFAGGKSQGIYEVLEHHTTLELQDPQGEVAVVERRQRVRFLQDNVEAISDHAWGDGELFAEYTCSPGAPVDCYRDGSRYTTLISLRQTMSRGDLFSFCIRRKILKGFLQPNECWETDIYQRTRNLSVTILFPKERRCQRATITQRNANKTVALDAERWRLMKDGRQKVTWEVSRPKLHERYALKWEW